ncbi:MULTISPECIES: baeRF3 domain-containing protein [Streptomyces]|uniref:baeRF3 domain-containing protein n=1 Tax=Streptomyces TaxID=1883 RepID=UPI00345B5688
MDIGDLTDEILRDLRGERPYPAVSLLVPTTRRSPYSPEDPVRLRNTVAEAKRRLAEDAGVSPSVRSDVEGQLDAAVAGVDLTHTSDGLLILAAPGEHHVWYLPRTVPQRVVVGKTFLTRNLVAAARMEEPYWALAVTKGECRLWDGAGDLLTEFTGNGFPVHPALPDHVDALPGKNYGTPIREEGQAERERQYLRTVAGALAGVLEKHPRPLYLVGLRELTAHFKDAFPDQGAITAVVENGSGAAKSGHELLGVLRPAFEERREARRGEVMRRLSDARGARRYTSGLDEVWQTVRQGRVALLAVEDHYQATVRTDGNGGHPQLVEESAEPLSADGSLIEDAVDEIVESALDSGADVEFVPDDSLAEEHRLAAVLRY